VIDELIEDLELVSADGAEVLQEAAVEVGKGLLLAGEYDEVGGGEAVGSAVAGGASFALGSTGAAGEFRVGPIGLDLRW
jgi:hypothetical protein